MWCVPPILAAQGASESNPHIYSGRPETFAWCRCLLNATTVQRCAFPAARLQAAHRPASPLLCPSLQSL